MPIESGLIRKNATRTIGLCCIFHYVSATQNLRRNKEKRRGVLMVKSGIEKMKIHKKSVNIHSIHLTRVNIRCIIRATYYGRCRHDI